MFESQDDCTQHVRGSPPMAQAKEMAPITPDAAVV